MTKQNIAKICHEANRALCQTLGDNSQPTWEDAPDWQKSSSVNGVTFHMESHAKGITPAPSASHDSWLAQKREEGWKYGPVKDPAKKEHPCFVAYNELPVEQRLKDYVFGAIVQSCISSGIPIDSAKAV